MNEYEVRARTRKAALIAEEVWKAMKLPGVTTELLAEIDPGFWQQAAISAGVSPPSKETVIMIIELLRVRESLVTC